ncbi:SDR family NAD(P)-dependent oxidoreductase [Streptomyces phyllanthi]|uniref:SDR family oxidoreductase n=1 Tax=Streptomyces phyllanthi TaxID=1803180 RepID=A0A5N8VTN8_9ACTN|nr:SDR family oxidoreductase [Streptomyces phyllanthi]MPY38600.1 SDR family oxidoreductase [Streptomyces phyllanthi]
MNPAADDPTGAFEGKVVLVTGGGSGIGLATAHAFARQGASVVVAGRNRESLLLAVASIRGEGGEATAVVCDVRSAEQVDRLVEETVSVYGGLDIAFNNAGVSLVGSLSEFSTAQWEEVISTNLTGTFLLMRREVDHMRRNGGGVIVNSASNAAHMTLPLLAAYSASKAAVLSLTRAAGREFIAENVRINAISPGPVDTPMWATRPGESQADRRKRMAAESPSGRIGTAEEIADMVLWLASPQAAYVAGHDLVVDGAMSS